MRIGPRDPSEGSFSILPDGRTVRSLARGMGSGPRDPPEGAILISSGEGCSRRRGVGSRMCPGTAWEARL
ncbi:protein of unknown function [Microbacterium sp. Nx66]|nr:protein of unknown function [Microbacterium sp. Nx66]